MKGIRELQHLNSIQLIKEAQQQLTTLSSKGKVLTAGDIFRIDQIMHAARAKGIAETCETIEARVGHLKLSVQYLLNPK